jgi:sarcosine oxidase subunit beta
MLIDPDGVHWRHDDAVEAGSQEGVIAAFTKWDEPIGENWAVDDARWEREFRPAMVRRVPSLEGMGEAHGWSGLYEMTPDHNPVYGEHPDLGGFVIAAGFSGHGLMMSPASGLVVAELIQSGRSQTFDVSIFAPDRFARGALIHDAATI